MNIEKMVEEFIEKKALFTGCGMHEMTIPQYIELAKLVEQATLERAANKADSVGHHWSGAPARAFFELADEIRALKDSNE